MDKNSIQIFILVTPFIVVFLGICIWLTIKSSKYIVELEDNGISVLYKGKRHHFGFNKIKSISGGHYGPLKTAGERLIHIEFHEETAVGKKINFLPDPDMDAHKFIMGFQHSMVLHIKEKIAEANNDLSFTFEA